MTKSTSGGCDQFETSPDAIEPELRTALCERRQTDRLKTNYSIDMKYIVHGSKNQTDSKDYNLLSWSLICETSAMF